ncbi:AAA family ATPase [Bacteroidales bacterium OttesenSCG-928-I21]|nr:AAA family ATPase [Bacteroidales bacterium OttesenSCG-928-I21]
MMDYIEINGYKSIKAAKVELRPINILIGANGSGKSNFLSFFELLNSFYNRKLQEYINFNGGVDTFLYNGSKISKGISYKISFDNENIQYVVNLLNTATGLGIRSEAIRYPKDKDWLTINFELQKESELKRSDTKAAKEINTNLDSIKSYHFNDTSINSPFVKMSNIENDFFYLYNDGRNLAAYLYYIKETNKTTYNLIISTIQSVMPNFSDFYLQPNDNNFLALKWNDKYSDTVYGVNNLSDGTQRFIALAVLFLQPNPPKTIIIDEPELGLHPFAVAKLAGMIKSAAGGSSQVIVATQSAELISNFDFEDIIAVDSINGESVFNRLNSEDWKNWIDNYTIGDLWRQNILNKGDKNLHIMN